MSLISATDAEFTAFLTERNLTIADTETALVVKSFDFVETLSFCSEPDADVLVKAQCFIAYAMSANGGGFNPSAIAESRTLIEKGLGSGAIVKKWSENAELIGTDPKTLLKTVPSAYGLLKGYLCSNYGAFVV